MGVSCKLGERLPLLGLDPGGSFRSDAPCSWLDVDGPSRGFEDIGLEGRAVRIEPASRCWPAGPSDCDNSPITMHNSVDDR
jgi:hypothetical protein